MDATCNWTTQNWTYTKIGCQHVNGVGIFFLASSFNSTVDWLVGRAKTIITSSLAFKLCTTKSIMKDHFFEWFLSKMENCRVCCNYNELQRKFEQSNVLGSTTMMMMARITWNRSLIKVKRIRFKFHSEPIKWWEFNLTKLKCMWRSCSGLIWSSPLFHSLVIAWGLVFFHNISTEFEIQ